MTADGHDAGVVAALHGVGRRRGRRWAVRHCSFTVPSGAVVGMVGPNGAGKSTLLQLVVGLLQPSEGEVAVLGGTPGRRAALSQVGFVAQGAPLHGQLRVAEVLRLGAALNRRWDAELAQDQVGAIGLRADQPVGALSGGQRARLALALALAKRPRLLVLDEPVASLDPLARQTFLRSLMGAVVDHGLTVLYSTHLMSDLQLACDRLVVVCAGRVLLDDAIEQVVGDHLLLSGPPGRPLPPGLEPVRATATSRQTTVLARGVPAGPPFGWSCRPPSLEDVVLAYLQLTPDRDQEAVA